MAKKKQPRNRKSQDGTLINNDARKKEIALLSRRVKNLEREVGDIFAVLKPLM